MNVHLGRIDQQIAVLPNCVHHTALPDDAIQQRPLLLERVGAPHLFEASDQNVIGRVEEDDLNVGVLREARHHVGRVSK